jgi:integrase/recombinase XerD
MKLAEAIDLYIRRRRSVGAYLHGPELVLRSFLHHFGNLDLHRIRTSQITKFLNGRRGVRARTWRAKHSALKLFFAYWCLRGRLRQSPVPLSVPKRPQDFVPYIYSRAELHRLLEALPRCQRPSSCRISAGTFRALLSVLYGTGMRLGEALKLRVADVNLTQDLVCIRECGFRGKVGAIPGSIRSAFRNESGHDSGMNPVTDSDFKSVTLGHLSEP